MKKFMIIIIFLSYLKCRLCQTSASLPSSCPQSYTTVSNGCYYIGLNSLNWQDANTFCINLITPTDTINGVKTHLVSIDTLTESIILNVYLKNLNYIPSFWTDGITSTSSKLKTWDWNNATFTDYGYLKYSFNNTGNIFITKNSSNNYEIHDESANKTLGYICEAQVLCSALENTCQNNATCYVNTGQVLCICPTGYRGTFCEISIDACLSSPCLNSGRCTNSLDGYSCNCTKNFYGNNCENAIPDGNADSIKLILIIFCSVVALFFLILCLLDLPVDLIISSFVKQNKYKQNIGYKQNDQSN